MRVLIGEDEALLRKGMALVLEQGGFDIVGEEQDSVSLIETAHVLAPDLVITDIRMPPTHTDDGLRAAIEIRREMPDTAVVVLSQHLQRRYAIELLENGRTRVGYLLKQRIADTDTFCADLRRVCAGGTALDPQVISLIVARASAANPHLRELTPRQGEVLSLMAEGRSNASIARQLSVSEKAVVRHVSNIYTELGIAMSEDDHRRVLAVIRYLAGN